MKLTLLVQLSWRNLWRHRRRTVILLTTICVAVGSVLVLNALLRGMQMSMVETAIDNLNGHFKVLAPGYLDDPGITKSFELEPSGIPGLSAEGIRGWAPRVRVPAVIRSERETRGVQFVGIVPGSEDISFLGDVDVDGEYLSGPDDRRILLGHALAEQLETGVGRRVVLITQGADGGNRESGYRVAGVYDAVGTGIEKAFVFTGLATVQDLLSVDAVTEVSVRLTEEARGPSVLGDLTNTFDGLDVRTWQDLEPQAAMMHEMADATVSIWFLIVMGALIFGLVNTLVTAVMERIRELGMLRAIGMRRGAVIAQVVIESMITMVIGISTGVVLGLLGFAWLAEGIDLSAFAEGLELTGLRPELVPQLWAQDVFLVVVLSLVLGFLASIYPAHRAVRVQPLDAMRR
ncbi:MAG: FtsX-like permease family protein [Gammaproteobacteria bacterium]|nr:FtsX-like permease family protein [Gammaproteobacteria bacterium]